MEHTYSMLFYGGLIACTLLFITTVILFTVLHIPRAIGDLTGSNAKKSIEGMKTGKRSSTGRLKAKQADISKYYAGTGELIKVHDAAKTTGNLAATSDKLTAAAKSRTFAFEDESVDNNQLKAGMAAVMSGAIDVTVSEQETAILAANSSENYKHSVDITGELKDEVEATTVLAGNEIEETTVLANSDARNEIEETTVLAGASGEDEGTTVLANAPFEKDEDETETTVLVAEGAAPVRDEDETETTILASEPVSEDIKEKKDTSSNKDLDEGTTVLADKESDEEGTTVLSGNDEDGTTVLANNTSKKKEVKYSYSIVETHTNESINFKED